MGKNSSSTVPTVSVTKALSAARAWADAGAVVWRLDEHLRDLLALRTRAQGAYAVALDRQLARAQRRIIAAAAARDAAKAAMDRAFRTAGMELTAPKRIPVFPPRAAA